MIMFKLPHRKEVNSMSEETRKVAEVYANEDLSKIGVELYDDEGKPTDSSATVNLLDAFVIQLREKKVWFGLKKPKSQD